MWAHDGTGAHLTALVAGFAAEGLASALAFGVLLPLSVVFKLDQRSRDCFARAGGGGGAAQSTRVAG